MKLLKQYEGLRHRVAEILDRHEGSFRTRDRKFLLELGPRPSLWI